MTAIVHDPKNVLHAAPGHPERMERYTAIMEALGRSGLLGRMVEVPVRLASAEEIGRAHQPEMIAIIEQAVSGGGGMLDPDTYCTAESWEIARNASGGFIDLCASVAGGEHPNGLAVLRPPGHHATATGSMGFCLINHAAVAARSLQAEEKSTGGVKKIAVVDFDVHHGNGTEDIFATDETIFYASTHQYPHYPGTGGATDRGTGKGEGFTLNVPLPAGTGDEAFILAYSQAIVPALREFSPDFIIVSAGYDAHRDDPLAGLEISTAGFRELCQLLTETAGELCNGKIVFTLEGGYNLDVLAICVADTADILLKASSG